MTKTKYRWTEEEQVQVKSVKVVRKLRVFGGKDLWKRYALRPVTARVHTICELFSSAVCTTYSCRVSAESSARISTTQRSCRPSQVAVVEHHEGHWTVGHQHSLVRVRLYRSRLYTLWQGRTQHFSLEGKIKIDRVKIEGPKSADWVLGKGQQPPPHPKSALSNICLSYSTQKWRFNTCRCVIYVEALAMLNDCTTDSLTVKLLLY